MKNEFLLQRQWAETVRLYSGLLEKQARIDFIKSIANENILLAAECRTTSFLNEDDLDDFLTETALQEAKKFKTSQVSAKGIMALVELNKFDYITQIFSAIKNGSNSSLHNEVVANYIANGSELQISTFLKVLAESNFSLLDRAIDKVFDLNIFFTSYSILQLKNLAIELFSKNELILAAKLLCAISVKINGIDKDKIVNILLTSLQLKYAKKIAELYKFVPLIDILHYLSIYVHEGLSREFLIRYLTFAKTTKSKYDLGKIRVELSKHSNPKVKSLAFEYEIETPLSNEVIFEIYLENIKIASISSIEFALSTINRFGLQNKIGIDSIVENLLVKPKGRRLELIYKLVKDYNLSKKYPFKFLFYLALNINDHQSYNLARKIVLNEFDFKDQNEALMYLSCITLCEQNSYKLAKEIIFNDVQFDEDLLNISINKNYYGFVSNYYNGNYQIYFGAKELQLNGFRGKVGRLKIHNFIKFKLVTREDKIQDSNIKVLHDNVFGPLIRKYYFGKMFYGKILSLNVIRIEKSRIFLTHNEFKKINFIISIEDISNSFVKNINDYFFLNQTIKAMVVGSSDGGNNVFCSSKDFIDQFLHKVDYIESEDLEAKINSLKKKFKQN